MEDNNKVYCEDGPALLLFRAADAQIIRVSVYDYCV
jgi:hypothetical protein